MCSSDLLRDSLMTGAKYGIYDLEWVLHALKIDEHSDRVYVESKGLYAVEEYLQARYYMFRQVYFHRTLRSAEAVLVSTLRRARHLIERNELSGPAKPLAKERWAGGVDSVGSTTLANLLSMTKYGGAVAACGLAAGMDLPTSVAPFILRGVCLLGIDSVMCPIEQRKVAWSRLARDLDQAKLAEITHEIGLGDVIGQGAKILAGQEIGRASCRERVCLYA